MRIRDIFFRNFWWKLASVILATLIWFNYEFPRGRQLGGKLALKLALKLNLSVVPMANNADVRRFKTDPPEVTVWLEGEDNDLKYVKQADLHAVIFVTEGMRTNGARFKVEVSGLPPGVSVTGVEPGEVKIYTPPGS